ncbi:hypothetical protein Ae201684P_000153 [Aphanomyces euteiches]|nr:hypothetical protein Ae201684P_000153 [Aphanomyces euteiches]KAH9154805.1 hypothetical protein AeRB84_003153 [Aphanomyces euteiches]
MEQVKALAGRLHLNTPSMGSAEIVVTSRSVEKLTVVKEKVNELYPNTIVHVIPADLSSEENSKDFVVAALTALNQKVDVLVLNHIIPSPFGHWLQSPHHHSVLSQILHTNTFSHIWIATAIVEAIAPRGSTLQIGVVGSLASQMGAAKGAAYSTSKHALFGFFNAFGTELSILGINNVHITQCIIGATDTEGAAETKRSTKNIRWDPAEVTATGIARGIAFQKRDIYQPHSSVFPFVKFYQIAPWVMDEIFKTIMS